MKQEMYDLLNNQVNFEIYSAHIYLDMSGYASSIGFEGFANWYDVQYQEEMTHAKKLMKYILDNGFRPEITNWEENPTADYDGILETAKVALAHEQVVTQRFNYMMEKALEYKDFATVNFLNWYINEQVEEEANFNDMINKIELVKDAGLYLLDQEYASRTFVDETAAE